MVVGVGVVDSKCMLLIHGCQVAHLGNWEARLQGCLAPSSFHLGEISRHTHAQGKTGLDGAVGCRLFATVKAWKQPKCPVRGLVKERKAHP